MMERTVLEKVEEFKEKNPDVTNALLSNEMEEIYELGNVFEIIATAFFLGYRKAVQHE